VTQDHNKIGILGIHWFVIVQLSDHNVQAESSTCSAVMKRLNTGFQHKESQISELVLCRFSMIAIRFSDEEC
jgi:hypothetical protein